MHRAVLLAVCCVALAPSAAPAADEAPLRLLVPAYFYPAGDGLKEWEKLIAAHDPARRVEVVVVANIDSGRPGKAVNADYARVIKQAAAKGVRVVAYVDSGYGKVPLEQVKGHVADYFRLYPEVSGVFVDQQSSDGALVAPYYAPLRRHVLTLRPGALVVTNAGTVCDERYLSDGKERTAADVVVVYENSEAAMPFARFRPPEWAKKYPPERFAMLAHTSAELKDVAQAREKHVGWVYVTDKEGPPGNPWDRLPKYWADEVRRVGELNR
jgi:hypothetical protein